MQTRLTVASSPWVREIELAADEVARAAAKAAAAARGAAWNIDRDWMQMSQLGRRALDESLSAESTRAIATACHQPILLIRRAVTVEDLPATPASGFGDDAAIARWDSILLGICSLRGIQPTAYPFENEGRLARNVVPNPSFSDAESSWGYGKGLHWHQDNNFQPLEFDDQTSSTIPPMPRYLAFLALRNLEMVPTQLLPIEHVLSRISGDDIEALQTKAFLIAPPESARACSRSYAETSEIVSVRDGVAYSKFDTSDGVTGCDSHAEAVVRRFREAVTEAAEEAIDALLQPGDVLIFDNYRMLHRRERFTPHSTSEGRWLRRLYGLTAKQSSDLLQ